MRAPVSWLRELVDLEPGATGADVAASLVRVGLEEEGLHGGDVTGPLVLGRVLSAEPEAQKNGKTVNWCQVDVGDANGTGEPQGIVCGAHNFAAGDLVVVILPGGVLPGGLVISARKTYGHVSAGMICSAAELGLGEGPAATEGIIVLTDWFAGDEAGLAALERLAPGDDAIGLLGLDEEVVEVNVTPDRGYCLSLRGIAREYALSTGQVFHDPAAAPTPEPVRADAPGFPVRLEDTAPIDGRPGCDRYVARVVRGVDVGARTPAWMALRLTRAGMRPISLPVDVTNYVMLLLGQPLHAFDLDTLSGSIVVRRARPGERLRTLDDVDRTLDPEDLLITDGGTTPLALAGVMGGETSEVGGSTSDVLVESAHFDATTVARTSRRHRLGSEASRRFERGVDPEVADRAAQLAVDLLVTLGGGTADPAVTDVDDRRRPVPFRFEVDLPTRYVGLEYPREEVLGTLRAVGCEVDEDPGTGTEVEVSPPSWRPDLVDGPDLVEEVARVRGYDQIPSVIPEAHGRGLTRGQRVRRLVARTLAQQGLVEVLSYPFVAPGLFDRLGYAEDDPRRLSVRLANPLQEEAPLMRTSVLDTLLDVLRRNVGRGQRDVAVYELGLVVRGSVSPRPAPVPPADRRPEPDLLAEIEDAVPAQPRHVAFAAAGEAEPPGPWGTGRPVDPTDAVAWARTLAEALGLAVEVEAAEQAPWHPGRCARVHLGDGTVVGYVGELHPKVVTALDLPPRTVAGELDVDVLVAASGAPLQAEPLSTYPAARTDVALVVAEDVPAAEVERALRDGAGAELESLALFDLYRGGQVGEGQKSLAYRLTFRPEDHTMTTDEVSALRDVAIAAAARATGAVQRGA